MDKGHGNVAGHGEQWFPGRKRAKKKKPPVTWGERSLGGREDMILKGTRNAFPLGWLLTVSDVGTVHNKNNALAESSI